MAAPTRVGILHDMDEAVDSASPAVRSLERVLRARVEDLLAEGRLDRDVEFVHAGAAGLPTGTARSVERAYAELVDAGALLIIGPAIGDNALVATPLAEAAAVPTLNWAGTERARGEWMFHLQVGSHEDENVVLARYVADAGARRVGVVYDRSPIGRRHLAFFTRDCEVLGVRIATAVPISPVAEDATAELEEVRASGADALVYLGLGLAARYVGQARAAAGWDVPRALNTAGLRGYDPAFARDIDGWAYIDMRSDGNTVLQQAVERVGDAMGPMTTRLAWTWDMSQLLAEGLARATEHTRAGVREGLEQIKWVPAAEGYEGTMLSFGHYDRGALHGRYMVLRQWRDGVSVEL